MYEFTVNTKYSWGWRKQFFSHFVIYQSIGDNLKSWPDDGTKWIVENHQKSLQLIWEAHRCSQQMSQQSILIIEIVHSKSPCGDAREANIRGSSKSLEVIIWEPWLCVPNINLKTSLHYTSLHFIILTFSGGSYSSYQVICFHNIILIWKKTLLYNTVIHESYVTPCF